MTDAFLPPSSVKELPSSPSFWFPVNHDSSFLLTQQRSVSSTTHFPRSLRENLSQKRGWVPAVFPLSRRRLPESIFQRVFFVASRLLTSERPRLIRCSPFGHPPSPPTGYGDPGRVLNLQSVPAVTPFKKWHAQGFLLAGARLAAARVGKSLTMLTVAALANLSVFRVRRRNAQRRCLIYVSFFVCGCFFL